MRVVLDNSKAYDRATKGSSFSLFSVDHCCVCGKPTNKGTEWLLLTRAEDGACEYAISHPDEASKKEIQAGLWLAPIGPQCLKEHPELQHAIVGRKL